MEVVYNLIVVAHLLGMAAIVGGWLAVARDPRPSEVMVWGARIQVVTGLVLVGMAEAIDSLDIELDHAKVGVKLVVAIAVAACAEIARARGKRGENVATLVNAAGILAIVNVIVAAMWT